MKWVDLRWNWRNHISKPFWVAIKPRHKMRPMIRYVERMFPDKQLKGLEIGVAKGINAKCILKTLNIEKLYLVDIFDIPDVKRGKRIHKEDKVKKYLKEYRK